MKNKIPVDAEVRQVNAIEVGKSEIGRRITQDLSACTKTGVANHRAHQKHRDSLTLQNIAVELPHEGYLRLPKVLSVFPVSRSSWFAGIKSGRYPTGVKLGPRTRAWPVEQIRALLASFGAEAKGATHETH